MSRTSIAGIYASLVAGVLLTSDALAITETSFRYAAPQTGAFQMPPSAFFPDSNTIPFTSTNGLSLVVGTNAFNCFSAPVNLPHGSTMTQMTVWHKAVAGGDNATGLFRIDVTDANFQVLINTSLVGTNNVRAATNFTVPADGRQIINNRRYNYILRFCLTKTTSQFWGGRITYEYSNAGD
jgi:hypothetical protein